MPRIVKDLSQLIEQKTLFCLPLVFTFRVTISSWVKILRISRVDFEVASSKVNLNKNPVMTIIRTIDPVWGSQSYAVAALQQSYQYIIIIYMLDKIICSEKMSNLIDTALLYFQVVMCLKLARENNWPLNVMFEVRTFFFLIRITTVENPNINCKTAFVLNLSIYC